MIRRYHHTQLTRTTPALDASAVALLADDLSPAQALEFLSIFTSLLDTRITEIAQALTHQPDQNTPETPAAHEPLDVLLNLRAGSAMIGARRIELLTATALTDRRTGNITPEPLIRELKAEARRFTLAATRLHHPSAYAA